MIEKTFMAEQSGSILGVYTDPDAIINSIESNSDNNDDLWLAKAIGMPQLNWSLLCVALTKGGSLIYFMLMTKFHSLFLAFVSFSFADSARPENLSFKLEIERALDRGIKWLNAEQNASGGHWGDPSYPALTGLVFTSQYGFAKSSYEWSIPRGIG